MYLKDPHDHLEMIQALESRFKVEECSFKTIFGTFEGHRIYASRKVAELIGFMGASRQDGTSRGCGGLVG
jgi:DNA polymerase I